MLKASRFTAFYVTVLVFIAANQAFAQGRELTPDRVNQRLQAAAVEILVNGRLAGSGAVIDRDGVINVLHAKAQVHTYVVSVIFCGIDHCDSVVIVEHP